MANEKRNAWLSKQISEAHDSFSAWPEWMKSAAKFEDSQKKYVSNQKSDAVHASEERTKTA